MLDGGPDLPMGRYNFEGKWAANCARTAEPFEMPFGLSIWVGPRNHVRIRWGRDRPMGRDNFYGKGHARDARRHPVVSCAKVAGHIDMSRGLWTIGWARGSM